VTDVTEVTNLVARTNSSATSVVWLSRKEWPKVLYRVSFAPGRFFSHIKVRVGATYLKHESLIPTALLCCDMVDALVCERCGIACSYADAYVADLDKSCQKTKTRDGREITVRAKHEWVEPLHEEIPVVSG
jgi:hypothetical protein